jgi:hypothetical protein
MTLLGTQARYNFLVQRIMREGGQSSTVGVIFNQALTHHEPHSREKAFQIDGKT